jgi:DNA gyrase subunit A
VGAGPVKPRGDVLIVTQNGDAKRTSLSDYPTQGRYGQGVVAIKLAKDSGPVAVATTANVSDRVMLIAKNGNNKTVYAKSISKIGRNQKGKAFMSIRGRNEIARLVTLADKG